MLKELPDLGFRWWTAVRTAPEVRRKVPLEAAISYPIGAPGELRFFHYRTIDGNLQRPFSYVRAAIPDMHLLEVECTSAHHMLFPGLPEVLGQSQVKRDLALEEQMLNLLPRLMALYPNKKSETLGKQYLEAFSVLTEKALMPFYYALNPEFLAWLER